MVRNSLISVCSSCRDTGSVSRPDCSRSARPGVGNALPQLAQNGATLEFVVAQNGQLISGKLIAPGSYSGSDAELPSVWERPFRSRWDRQRFEPAGAGSPHTTHFARLYAF